MGGRPAQGGRQTEVLLENMRARRRRLFAKSDKDASGGEIDADLSTSWLRERTRRLSSEKASKYWRVKLSFRLRYIISYGKGIEAIDALQNVVTSTDFGKDMKEAFALLPASQRYTLGAREKPNEGGVEVNSAMRGFDGATWGLLFAVAVALVSIIVSVVAIDFFESL